MPCGNPHLPNQANHMLTRVIFLNSPNWPIRSCHVIIFLHLTHETLTLIFSSSATLADSKFSDHREPPSSLSIFSRRPHQQPPEEKRSRHSRRNSRNSTRTATHHLHPSRRQPLRPSSRCHSTTWAHSQQPWQLQESDTNNTTIVPTQIWNRITTAIRSRTCRSHERE